MTPAIVSINTTSVKVIPIIPAVVNAPTTTETWSVFSPLYQAVVDAINEGQDHLWHEATDNYFV